MQMAFEEQCGIKLNSAVIGHFNLLSTVRVLLCSSTAAFPSDSAVPCGTYSSLSDIGQHADIAIEQGLQNIYVEL